MAKIVFLSGYVRGPDFPVGKNRHTLFFTVKQI